MEKVTEIVTERLKDLEKNMVDNEKTRGIINSYCNSNSGDISRFYASPVEARNFAETLDSRVIDEKFIPFYCKAIMRLGHDRVARAQSMALDPSVRNPERMFSWLLKHEMEAVR